METLGVGIIGFGFIGKVHAYGYLNMPLYYDPVPVKARLVGVATSNPATATKAAEQGGFVFGTDDWRELIARDDIQIINICSPNSLHSEQLLAAMEAGKHVYCDKPMVANLAEAERVESALKDYKGVGQVTFQYRFYPPALRAKQLIEEGFLGEIISFRAAFLHSGNVDPERVLGWKQSKAEGGGVLRDLGSHTLDLLDYLIGPLDSLMAQTRVLYPMRKSAAGEMMPLGGDDQVVLLAKLRNGAVGTVEASKIATGVDDEMRFEIHGDKGALRFNLMNPNYLEAYDMRDPDAPIGGERGWTRIATVNRFEKPGGFPGPKFSIGWMRGHVHCLYNFLSAIANEWQPEPSLARGVYVERVLAAAQKSADTQAWQSVAGL